METQHRPVSVDDLLDLKQADDSQVSPDGCHVAFSLTDPPVEPDGRPATHLWIVPSDGAAPARPLTAAGPHTDRHPRWSPDGSTLAFLSNRGDEKRSRLQLYLLPMAAGGEAVGLTDAPAGVGSFAWSPDGREIAFLAREPGPEPSDTVVLYEEAPRCQRLWVIDVASRAVREVTPADLQVWEFAWSPDGSQFALIVSRQPYEWSWYESWLARAPAGGGECTPVHRSRRQLALPLWSPGGDEIYFLSSTWSDRSVAAGDVFAVPAAGGAARHLTGGYPASFTWMAWQPDGTLLLCGYAGLDCLLAALPPGGAVRPLWQGPVALLARAQARFSLSRDGRMAAMVREDTRHPADVWSVTLSGGPVQWRQLTDWNPWVRERFLGAAEELRWQGPGELEVQGLLIRPPDLAPGERCPLVVYVHGGPTAAYAHRFSQGYGHLLAGQGCAVLLPNPRGSVGRGLAFAEANLGDMGGGDFYDIMAGADACVAMGVADPGRLGIAGYSYGGFMAAWTITQTDRFRAAMVGAAVTHWRSFHGTTEIQTWDALYQQRDPRDPGYNWNSPLHQVHKVQTPALVIHGDRDAAVPAGQGFEFWRALREQGVEAVLALYPGSGHGITNRAQVRDMAQRIMAWFGRHLGFGGSAAG